MRFDDDHRSSFVEDRRGQSPGGGIGAGGLVLLFWIFRRFGIVGVVLVVGGYFLFQALSGSGGMFGAGGEARDGVRSADDDEMVSFVSFVLDDAQQTWQGEFAERNRRYDPAHLVLFTDRVQSACGLGSAAVGPFYCPRDQKVYIDLSFYRALRDRLGAPGDFAQAYVIAHEIGHHVQNLQGNLERGHQEGAGGGSVRTELQADCYAGVWAHSTDERKLLEQGDIAEAMRAAEAIGDDTLQERSGAVRPETWTHGSSAQRMQWFQRGYQSGSVEACDTFAAGEL